MNEGKSNAERLCLLAWLFLAGAASVALWPILETAIASSRGLDLTDEGLYLLTADSHSPRAQWGFPSGWHTAPLFGLVGYDIAAFRTLGAWLLCIFGGLLGFLAFSTSVRQTPGSSSKSVWDRLPQVCAVGAGISGALLYYAGLLSTPSYNWVNLAGIYIADCGFLIVSSRRCEVGGWWCWRDSVGVLVVGLGLFFSIPGKPSTAPILLCGGMLLVVLVRRNTRGLVIGFAPVCAVGFFILAAVACGFWERSFLEFFVEPFRKPLFRDGLSTRDAIFAFLEVPRFFWTEFSCAGRKEIFGYLMGLVLLVAGGIAEKRKERLAWLPAFLGWALVLFVAARIAKIPPVWVGNEKAFDRFLYQPTVTALCLVAIASLALFSAFQAYRKQGSLALGGGGEFFYAVVRLLFLVSLPFVYGFGSDNGIYRQASMAGGFFLVAAMLGISSLPGGMVRNLSAIMVLSFGLLLSHRVLMDAHLLPYRKAPISEQTIPTEIGARGAILYLEPSLSGKLEELKRQAIQNGWVPGTPLLGVVWDWSSTVPYFLGARVPDCLMLTLFRYPGSVAVGKYNIKNSLGDFPSEKAWILTNVPGRDPGLYSLQPAPLNEKSQAEVNEVLAEAARAGGREFPRDYQLAAETIDYQLWKPLQKIQ